ncbi:MAG TPA: hypothetical protein VFG79_16045, partial [Solirubrobacter sp.]|nr:hypothetical protein [Solirubrobacter sp.]
WVVGGAVRDCAAGLPVRDVDLAVGGDAARFARDVTRRGGGEAKVRAPHLGTAAVLTAGGRLDLAPLRRERYAHPGAMPEVTAGASIEEDLARRDFSVNAVAFGLAGPCAGVLADPIGGLPDLAARRLRVLHERSFEDDATRLWRGARVAAQHRLRPDAATAALIEDGVRWLDCIAGERLWTEFRLTAPRPYVAGAVTLLDAWGVLRGTHPAWRLAPQSRGALGRRRRVLDAESLAALLLAPLDARDAILDRLAAPPEVRRAVEQTAALAAPPVDAAAGAPALDWLEAHEGTSEASRRAAEGLAPPEEREAVRRRHAALARWQRTRSPFDGDALIALGVPRGPEVGAWLRRLRRARYLGTLGSAAEARRLVRSGRRHDEAGTG